MIARVAPKKPPNDTDVPVKELQVIICIATLLLDGDISMSMWEKSMPAMKRVQTWLKRVEDRT